MNDQPNFTGFLGHFHITETAEDLENLQLIGGKLDPKRLSRANTTFAFGTNLPRLQEYMKAEMEEDKTILFPMDSQNYAGSMLLAKSKWPKHAQENVLFDLRDTKQEKCDRLNLPDCSFNQDNEIWGDMTSQPQLLYQSKTAFTGYESSVHYIKDLDEPVILHIGSCSLLEEDSNPATGEYKTVFKSNHRIVFEFFNPGKDMEKIENLKEYFDTNNAAAAKKHKPIMIEPEGLDCAYVVRDFDAESELSQGKKGRDSFLVALYSTGANIGKFIRFKRKGDYWETYQYKQSDLTDFLGLPWDLVRENAMLETESKHAPPKYYAEKYWEKFWGKFKETIDKKDGLNKQLEDMKNLQE